MDIIPNFICVGVQKAGTTWLYEELNKHQDITMPSKKELRNFDPWPSNPNYLKNFKNCTGITGDITPEYFYGENSAHQIKAIFPDCKLFVILRNPSDRAFSQWRMARNLKNINLNKSFIDCFKENARDMRYRGLYLKHILKFKSVFPNFKVVIYDNLVKDPKSTIESICEFIGAEPKFENSQWLDMPYSDDNNQMSLEDSNFTIEYYKSSITELEEYLNIHIGW